MSKPLPGVGLPGGTTGRPRLSPASAGAWLRDYFPGQASRVLGEGSAHHPAVGGDGFAPALPAATDPTRAVQLALSRRERLTATFPHDGAGTSRFALADGFVIQVRELGTRGPGWLEASALVYPHERGVVFWSCGDAGYEEWLL